MASTSDNRECCVGIDVGGSYVKAGVVCTNGKIWAQRHQEVWHADVEGFLEQLIRLITELVQADEHFLIKGVGIGVPGLVTTRDSCISFSPTMPYLNGMDLKATLAKDLGLPVVIDNDANAGAYGEMQMGAAKSVQNFIYISIGTRVGASIVLNRSIYRGTSGYAGELGHSSVDPDGKLCFCGRRGCLESYVSAPSIAQRVEERISLNPTSTLQIIANRPVTAQDVSAAAALGDPMASVILGEVAHYLGIAIAGLINFYNPEMIILGGGVIGAGDVLLQPTIEEVRRRALPPCSEDCQIVSSSLGASSGIIGASLLACNRFSRKPAS